MAHERRTPGSLTLPTGQVLPDLRLIASEEIALHEEADPVRVERLVGRLRADGVLRNPPVAAAREKGGFVVLDGANRTSALRSLGAPAVLLQIVDYADAGIRLDVWRHLIMEAIDLPAAVRNAGVSIERTSPDAASKALEAREIACFILTGRDTRRETFGVPVTSSRGLAGTLAQVVATYKGAARIYRVPTEDFDTLAREYGEPSAIVVFPRLRKEDILEIASAPVKLPTGITRHLIPGRALRLNLPLDLLTSPGDLEEKNTRLRELIRRRLLDNAVRYYPEGAFLFDE